MPFANTHTHTPSRAVVFSYCRRLRRTALCFAWFEIMRFAIARSLPMRDAHDVVFAVTTVGNYFKGVCVCVYNTYFCAAYSAVCVCVYLPVYRSPGHVSCIMFSAASFLFFPPPRERVKKEYAPEVMHQITSYSTCFRTGITFLRQACQRPAVCRSVFSCFQSVH